MKSSDIKFIAIFGLLIYFLGNAQTAITDTVESNYALTAVEMLAAGDYTSPRIYGTFWYDKPAMFYWELIAAFKLFGINEFAARFFPGVFATATLVLTYLFGTRLYGRMAGFASALILGTSIGYWYIAKAVATDMTLLFCISSVLMTFFLGFTTQNRRWYYLSWIFAGLGTLTKGPIGLVLPGLLMVIFLLLRRRPGELLHLKWPGGILLFLLMGSEWYYVMYQLHGWDFLGAFLGTHNVLRATVAEHARDSKWYYYILIFLIAFIPWWPVFFYRLRKYWKSLDNKRPQESTLFLLVWFAGVNIFFQLMATKYATYTLPGMVPMAIIMGRLLADQEKLVKRLAIGCGILYAVLGLTLVPKLCGEQFSAKLVAEAIRTNTPESAIITTYGSYPTSAVYYSGRTIYWTSTDEELEKFRPKPMSWTANNVMPFMSTSELPGDKDIYIICKKLHEKKFLQVFPEDSWELVTDTPNSILVKLKKAPMTK